MVLSILLVLLILILKWLCSKKFERHGVKPIKTFFYRSLIFLCVVTLPSGVYENRCHVPLICVTLGPLSMKYLGSSVAQKESCLKGPVLEMLNSIYSILASVLILLLLEHKPPRERISMFKEKIGIFCCLTLK